MSVERSAARWMAAWAAVALLGAAGCTMCPNPYDYSGPVPDGSPPQNDFRARAGGILPIGATPKPWPPVVEANPAEPASVLVQATPAPTQESARPTDAAAVQPASVEEPVAAPADIPPADGHPAPDDAEPADARETPGWRPRG